MAEMIEDELLVERFSRGDEAAFNSIVERYSSDIAILANRLLGWPGEVDDVMQDIFLAAFIGLKRFRRDCSLKTWLFTITINKCRSYRYRQKLRQTRTIPIKDFKASLPHVETADKETYEQVRRAVAALPAKYREPIVFKYLQEFSTDETSRILGVSQNALEVRLSRARKMLRQELSKIIEQ